MKNPAIQELCRMTVHVPIESCGAELRVAFEYYPADPHAVVMVVSDLNIGGVTEWTFDRSLLRDGLDASVGLMDVRVAPYRDDRIAITLQDSDSVMQGLVPRASVARWVSRSYEAVPDGMERFDADACLGALLTGT